MDLNDLIMNGGARNEIVATINIPRKITDEITALSSRGNGDVSIKRET